jgi:hypothetical protein
VGSSRKTTVRLIGAGTAILLFAASFSALYAQAPGTLKAAENKSQLSAQEQSVRRDQAYVRALLERGTSDAKVEVSLKLTSGFTSFNSSSDFHSYALGLISKERKALQLAKQTQRSSGATQTASAAAISVSSPAPNGNLAAPSNPVGISNVKASQESRRDNAQDTTQPSTDGNQVVVPNSSQPTLEVAYFYRVSLLLRIEAVSFRLHLQASVRTLPSSPQRLEVPPRRNHPVLQARSTLTKALGPGQSVLGLDATCSRRRPRWVLPFR